MQPSMLSSFTMHHWGPQRNCMAPHNSLCTPLMALPHVTLPASRPCVSLGVACLPCQDLHTPGFHSPARPQYPPPPLLPVLLIPLPPDGNTMLLGRYQHDGWGLVGQPPQKAHDNAHDVLPSCTHMA
jgi:hypothetical protein